MPFPGSGIVAFEGRKNMRSFSFCLKAASSAAGRGERDSERVLEEEIGKRASVKREKRKEKRERRADRAFCF